MENMCLISSFIYSQGKTEAIKNETFYLFYHIICVKKYATRLVTIFFLQIDNSQVKYFHMWVTFWTVLPKDKVKSKVIWRKSYLEMILYYLELLMVPV